MVRNSWTHTSNSPFKFRPTTLQISFWESKQSLVIQTGLYKFVKVKIKFVPKSLITVCKTKSLKLKGQSPSAYNNFVIIGTAEVHAPLQLQVN